MARSHSLPSKEQQLTTTFTPTNLLIFYKLDAENETMPIHLFPGFPDMVLDYLGGDVNPASDTDKKTENPSNIQSPLMLFGKSFEDLKTAVVAKHILYGEEKEALELVKTNPNLLQYDTVATDPLGRRFKGTLIQIAAMSTNMNLVKKLIAKGNLSPEEVGQQLQCMISEEAIQALAEKNERILAAIKKFGEGIIQVENKGNDETFASFKVQCQPLIAQLEIDLQPEKKEIATANKGFIIPPRILHSAAFWFHQNLAGFKRLWSLQSDLFWIHVIGKLQKLLLGNAQIMRERRGPVINGRIINPPPPLTNNPILTHLGLGEDFYLGYNNIQIFSKVGRSSVPCALRVDALKVFQNLYQAKTAVLHQLCQQNNSEHTLDLKK